MSKAVDWSGKVWLNVHIPKRHHARLKVHAAYRNETIQEVIAHMIKTVIDSDKRTWSVPGIDVEGSGLPTPPVETGYRVTRAPVPELTPDDIPDEDYAPIVPPPPGQPLPDPEDGAPPEEWYRYWRSKGCDHGSSLGRVQFEYPEWTIEEGS